MSEPRDRWQVARARGAMALVAIGGCAAVWAASPAEIACPDGSVARRMTTREVTDAWCETIKDGRTVKHGPYRSWYPSGRPFTQGEFEYGNMVGHWIGWYENGRVQGEEWYENGTRIRRRYLDEQGREFEVTEGQ